MVKSTSNHLIERITLWNPPPELPLPLGEVIGRSFFDGFLDSTNCPSSRATRVKG